MDGVKIQNRIKNLFARYGTSDKKILGFLGHSDVVPAGKMWKVEPFDAVLKDGYLYGHLSNYGYARIKSDKDLTNMIFKIKLMKNKNECYDAEILKN